MQLISSKRNNTEILEIEHYINEALCILNQTAFNRLLTLNMCFVAKIIGKYEKISITGYSLKSNPDKNSDFINPSNEWKNNKQYIFVPSVLNNTQLEENNKKYRWAVDYINNENTNFDINSNRVCIHIGSVSDFKIELDIRNTKPFIGISVFDTDCLIENKHIPNDDLDADLFINHAKIV